MEIAPVDQDTIKLQNEACQPCRAVKRRCIHPDQPGAVCTRCERLKLPCVYGQAKRGRKPGEPQARRKKAQLAAGTSSPEPLPPAVSEAMNPTHDWLYHDLNTAQSSQPHFPIASTSRIDPVGEDPLAAFTAVYPTPIPHVNVVSPPAPSPATGGFSLKKLLGARGEAPPRHSLADAFAVEEELQSASPVAEKVFEDIVTAQVCPPEVVDELFAFYFEHLNPMTSVLDPALHTKDFVRARSPFLFSILCLVATKVAHHPHYMAALRYCKTLLGQAFEHGVNDEALVQALALSIFWGESTDDSGARKLAYAIRSAMDLGMHKRKPRPLPTDEHEARLVLSGERTWMYLTIADHRFANQRSLPLLIPTKFRYDPVAWILEHSATPCPSEAGLAPLVALSRLLDLYNSLLDSDNGELPNRTLLDHLGDASSTWARHWSKEENSKTTAIRLLPAQLGLVRFYGKVFRFQVDELHLLLAISSPAVESTGFDPMGSPVLMFGRCVRSALDVLQAYREEVTVLRYCFDSIFIGAASCGIWLVQNVSGMALGDRELVKTSLAATEQASIDAAQSPQSMAGYMARLTAHLLKKVNNLTAEPVAGVAPTAPPAFVSASPASLFADNQFGAMGDVNSLFGSSLMAHQMQQQQPFDFQQAPAPFFGNMLRPPNQLGDELVYPLQDDHLWQSLFPLYASGA